MHEPDRLIGQIQYKAPENFTHEVMKKIYSRQKSKQTAERNFRAGVSLVAAGLIVLFLNITPLMDVLIEKGSYQAKLPTEVVNPYRTANSIEYIALKIDYILQKPYELLTDQIMKEDLSYGK